MSLDYYHILLDFCEMNSVFEGIFRVLLFGKYFFGFSVRGKVFFWIIQKYPTPLIPVCRFVKSTPWAILKESKAFISFLNGLGTETKLRSFNLKDILKGSWDFT